MKRSLFLGLAVTLFLFFLCFYLKFTAPSLYVGDSGEFVVSSLGLGISHPPGYPLFNLLVKPLTILPYGSMVFRVNVSTCIFAACSILIAFIFFNLTVSAESAILGSSLMGISYIFWNNAIAPEVYHLHLIIVLFFLILIVKSLPGFITLFLLAFLSALGLGNHYLILYLLPIIGVKLFSYKEQLTLKRITLLLLFLLIGLTFLTYFPLRAINNPLPNWSNPGHITRLVSHVKRDVYRQLEFGASITITEKLQFSLHFLKLWINQFFIIFFPLSLGGLLILFRTRRNLFWLSLYIFIVHSLFTIVVFQFPYNTQNLVRVEPYFLPSILISFFWLAVSLDFIFHSSSLPFARQSKFLLSLFLVILSGYSYYNLPIFAEYQNINHRNVYYPFYYGKNMIDSTTRHSSIFTSEDTESNVLYYLTGFSGYRPDVNVISWNNSRINADVSKRGGLYLTLERSFANEKEFPANLLFPNQVLFQLTNKPDTIQMDFLPRLNFLNVGSNKSNDYRYNWLLCNTYIIKGIGSLTNGSKGNNKFLERAGEIANNDYLSSNNVGFVYYKYGFYQQAFKCFSRALQLYPRYPQALHNLGLIHLRLNNKQAAKENFQNALRINPEYQPSYLKLKSLE